MSHIKSHFLVQACKVYETYVSVQGCLKRHDFSVVYLTPSIFLDMPPCQTMSKETLDDFLKSNFLCRHVRNVDLMPAFQFSVAHQKSFSCLGM